MNKTRKCSFYLIITALILCLTFSVAGLFFAYAEQNENVAEPTQFEFTGSIESQYSVNEVINIPVAKIGGKIADFRIVFPDGTYSNASTVKVAKSGYYSIEYTAVINGRVYKTTKSFMVGDDLFTINGLGSSEFKEIGNSGVMGLYFNLYSGASITYNDLVDLNEFNGELDTLFKLHPYVSKVGETDITQMKITLTDAYNEDNYVTVRYEHSIHANNVTYLDAGFNGSKFCGMTLDFAHAPGSYYVDGMTGFKLRKGVEFDESKVNDLDYYLNYQLTYANTYYYLKFTETHDVYTVKNGAIVLDGNGVPVVSKAALGADYYGLKVKSFDETYAYLEGRNHAAFIDSAKYGTNIMGGFAGVGTSGGKNVDQTSGKLWIGLGYDVNTNIVYARSYSGEKYVVADFKNGNIFGEAFGGFTDGKVKITITPSVFTKGSCGMFITEMAGEKLTEIGCSTFVSDYTPEINVAYGEYTKDTVPAVKRGGTYKLFDATAYDPVEGVLPVKTTVYYGYNNLNKIQVNISDNKFVASRAGIYTVVYEATNSAGKTVKEIIEVNSIEDDKVLTLKLQDELNYDSVISAGTPVKVFSAYDFENAYGLPKLSAKAVLKSNDKIAFELTAKNGYTFTPVVSGEYDIIYQYSDYSADITDVRTITVQASNIVHYVTTSKFPDYIILNGKYDLNIVSAYTLDTGVDVKENIILSVYMGDDLIPIEGVFYAFPDYVTDRDTIKLVYSPDFESIDMNDCFVKEIPVIDTGLYTSELDMTKYLVESVGDIDFYTNENLDDEDIENDIHYDGIVCDVQSFADGRAVFSFINNLLPNPFKLTIKPFANEQEFIPFDQLNVYLHDVVDSENYVKATLAYKSGAWYTSVNGQKEIKISEKWGSEDDKFYINYAAQQGKMVINDFYNYTNITYFGSQAPATFDKGIKLVVEVIGQDGCGDIKLTNLSDIDLADSTVDLSPAAIDYAKDVNRGERSVGDIVTLNPFAVYDIFTPFIESSLSVTFRAVGSKKTENVYDVNGNLLKNCDIYGTYQFELKDYGAYTVTVIADDPENADNYVKHYYTINVTDYRKPVVEMDTRTRSAKVGASLVLPSFTVGEENYKCYVTVKAPNESFMTYVDISKATVGTKDDKYVFATKGEYIVTLVVYDAEYNFTETSYKVIVK